MFLREDELNDRKTRIGGIFHYMEKFTNDVIEGKTTKQLVLVPGPAGCGKSVRLIQILERFVAKDPENRRFIRVAGDLSAPGLYELCHEYPNAGDIIFLDDCKIRPEALDKFKAATDTLAKRTISHIVKKGDMPGTIDYAGKVICLTNDNVDSIIECKGRLANHYVATKDRAKFVNLFKAFKDPYDIIVAIHLLVDRGDFKTKPAKAIEAAIAFMMENARDVPDLSVRMFCDLMDIYIAEGPKKWKAEAEMSYLGTIR